MRSRNMIKKYTHNDIEYGYSLQIKGWRFNMPGNQVFISHTISNTQAHKVAHILSGSVKRCGHVDNLARANISAIGK